MSEQPCVSVVIPAFNLARFLPAAIDSALTQADPGGPVEVIVVDDGSADDTPEVLARYGDRIRTVRRENGGLVAAVDQGLSLVEGRYVALLDADDEWPIDRLARHVRALEARPSHGLVHGDMEVIDADGTVTSRSFFADQNLNPPEGRILGSLLGGNCVSGGGATFRASLLPALHPISAEAAYPDWWIAACVAAVAEIGLVDGVANRYRYHGANMGLGSGADAQPRIQRLELPWRRWMFANLLDDDSIDAESLANAYAALRFGLLVATSAAPEGARSLLDPGPERQSSPLPPLGQGARRSRELLRRLGRDPFDGAAMLDLELALRQEATLPPSAPPSPPLITLARNRPRLTIARLGEVAQCPELLVAFAEESGESEASTLAILAEPGEDPAPLVDLFESDPRLAGDRLDAQLIAAPATTPARALLATWADSVLSLQPEQTGYADVPPSPAVERVSRSADPTGGVPTAAATAVDAVGAVRHAVEPAPATSGPVPANPRVSVIVPCYNASATLAETVTSIAGQTFRDIELLIVDDGSTDDSVELARTLASTDVGIPISVHEIPHSGHPAYPRNAGMALARGELLACLDPDDLFTPEYLERCVATLDAHPEADFAYGDLHSFGGESQLWPREQFDFHELTRRNLLGANAVFRRELYEQTGGFDPSLPYEDWQFWLHCGSLGHLGIKSDGALWLYRVRADSRFRTYGSPRDRTTKASFVLRRPQLYSAGQQLWGRAVLDGDPTADMVIDDLGVIPEVSLLPAPRGLMRVAAPLRRADPLTAETRPRASIVVIGEPGSERDQACELAGAQLQPGGGIEVLVADDATTLAEALSASAGEYLSVLDARDRWSPDRMLRHVAALEADSTVAAVLDGALDSPAERSSVTFRRGLVPIAFGSEVSQAKPELDTWLVECATEISRVAAIDGIDVHVSTATAASDLLHSTRERVWLAKLSELTTQPALIDEFKRDGSADPGLTLVVIADPDGELEALVALVEGDQQLRDEQIDITVIDEPNAEPTRLFLASRATRALGTLALSDYEPVTSA